MKNKEKVYELLENLTNLKKMDIELTHQKGDLSTNERIALFIIHNLGKEDKISLTVIRNKMKIAPSTITPIITSLEKRGLVERRIDEQDRRNIYVNLSKKGKILTQKIDEELKRVLLEYINYMGEKNIEELIKLITKTKEFISYKKGDKKC